MEVSNVDTSPRSKTSAIMRSRPVVTSTRKKATVIPWQAMQSESRVLALSIDRGKKPGCWTGLSLTGWRSDPRRTSRFLSFDFPRRVMRDIHRKIAAGTCQCRHVYASKWLAAGDSLVLPGPAGDDMGATVHFRLRDRKSTRLNSSH